MSTTTTDLRSRVNELNQMILQGEILDAFDKFYAEDIVMEEDGDKRVGWEANREYEEQFVNNLTEFRDAEVFKQAAVQRWEDGKIVNEKFYKLG